MEETASQRRTWGDTIIEYLWVILRFSGLASLGNMMGRLRMVQKILGSAHRAHLVARTAYSVYPDPFAHVSRQCTRLKMSQTIVPRKMTLVLYAPLLWRFHS